MTANERNVIKQSSTIGVNHDGLWPTQLHAVPVFSPAFAFNRFSQDDRIRASLKGSVMQRLGTNADITIEYSRPGVKGRRIWGGLVPYGMAPGNEYSEGKLLL